jgi:hypothetical protein
MRKFSAEEQPGALGDTPATTPGASNHPASEVLAISASAHNGAHAHAHARGDEEADGDEKGYSRLSYSPGCCRMSSHRSSKSPSPPMAAKAIAPFSLERFDGIDAAGALQH